MRILQQLQLSFKDGTKVIVTQWSGGTVSVAIVPSEKKSKRGKR